MNKQQIIEQLDIWNTSNYAADARNLLRRELGWRPGMSFGSKLVDQLTNGSQPQQQNLKLKQKPTDIMDLMEDMVFDRCGVYRMARAILATGWDYVDPSGMMQKPPDDVQDFLQSCTTDVSKYSEMHLGRRNLLKMICDAYVRSLGS